MKMNKHNLKAKKKYEDEVFMTQNYGEVVVIEYVSAQNITVSFVETENEVVTTLPSLLSGNIKDTMQPTVFGVGFVGVGKYSPETHKKQYTLWHGLLTRCYSPAGKYYKQYSECKVSKNFHNFQFFAEWCEAQKGFNVKGFDIDKDLLSKNIKTYGENTCVFLPREINSFIALPKNKGQNLGVCESSEGRYRARVRVDYSNIELGIYDNQSEAFLAYKQAKENRAKELAEKWENEIDIRAYEALINWKVEG